MRSENDVKHEHKKKSNAINFDILIPSLHVPGEKHCARTNVRIVGKGIKSGENAAKWLK